MSGEHTPGPWHFTWDGEGQPGRIGVVLPCDPVEQCGYDSHCIALTQPGKFDARANAERIVQCVNAHDDLVAALETAKAGLEWYKDTHPESVDGSDDEAMAQIDAALAKAGVRP